MQSTVAVTANQRALLGRYACLKHAQQPLLPLFKDQDEKDWRKKDHARVKGVSRRVIAFHFECKKRFILHEIIQEVDFPLLAWSWRSEMESDKQDALSRWLASEQRSPKVRELLI